MKELSRLSYDQFEKSVLKARKGAEKSLYDIVSIKTQSKCSETDFKALCERNLRNGKFLFIQVIHLLTIRDKIPYELVSIEIWFLYTLTDPKKSIIIVTEREMVGSSFICHGVDVVD